MSRFPLHDLNPCTLRAASFANLGDAAEAVVRPTVNFLNLVGAIMVLIVGLWSAGPATADLTHTFSSATDVPVESGSYVASGRLDLALGYAPQPGKNLTVVKNTGPAFIAGNFDNAVHGAEVALTYNGTPYLFIANYYGGNGRSLVLQWATPGLAVWGSNSSGTHGDNNTNSTLGAIASVFTDGVMAGRTVVAVATGEFHCLALTSDGRMFGWGREYEGQLARPPIYDEAVPVAVGATGALAGKTVVAIAAGDTQSLALTSEGRVYACGSNYYGQLGDGTTTSRTEMVAVDGSGVLAGLKVTAIAAGKYHSLALGEDGRVFAWGDNSAGQLGCGNQTGSMVPVAVDFSGALAGKVVVGIAAGIGSSMALTADGIVYGWGANQYGQLGTGTTTSSSVPVAVTASGALAGKTVTAIAAGGWHGMALSADGKVFTWGNNGLGELGNNTRVNSSVPVAVTISGNVQGIAAGEYHSLAVTTTGGVQAWGSNNYGELGSATLSYRTTPGAITFSGVLAGRKAIAVAAGYDRCLALIDSGPPLITANPTGKLAAAGASVTFAVSAKSALPFVVRWQVSTSGTTGPFTDISANPTAATTSLVLSGVAAALNGYAYRAVLTNASGTSTTRAAVLRIVTWAADFGGADDLPFQGEGMVATGVLDVQLHFAPVPGTNLKIMKNTGPAFISGVFDNVAQGAEVPLTYHGVTYRFIANYYGGNGRSLVLQWPCVQVAAWGWNMYGQVGDNSTSDKSAPVAIGGQLDGRTVTAVVGGSSHSLALTADGRVFAWGNNASGQLGTGTTVASLTPVPVAADGTLAGRRVVAIAAGSSLSLALTSDGRLFGWGGNGNGMLGDNVTEARLTPFEITASGPLAGKVITGMAVGINHCLALTAEGRIHAWGSNSWRQLGNDYLSQGISGPVEVLVGGALAGKTVVDIAAGETRSVALTTDGQVFSWGANLSSPNIVSGTGALAGKAVTAIEGTFGHFLALGSDGRAYSWGSNFRGELGNGTGVDSSLPVAVNVDGVLAGKTLSALGTGIYHSLALSTDGGCYGWGDYAGSGNTGFPLPQSITGALAGRRVNAVSAGIQHNLAVYGTGAPAVTLDPANQLAAGGATVTFSAEARDPYPLTIQWQESAGGVAGPFADIAGNPTANTATLVLAGVTDAQNGHAYRAVFTNSAGFSITAAARLTLVNWTAVFNSAGDVPFVSDGVVASGNLTIELNHAPTPGTDLTVISNTGPAFIAGGFANIAQGGVVRLSHGGVTYAFIANYYGGNGRSLVLQWPWLKLAAWGGGGLLGNGTSTSSNVPVEVRSGGVLMATTVVGVSAGESHSLAVTAAGRVYGWGGSSSGQLGNGGTASALEPVAVDMGGALAGQTVVAAVAGGGHSLALTSDGRAFAWGSGSSGQLGNGATTNGLVPVPVNTAGALAGKALVSVAAGYSHSLALTSEGRVLAWGSNSSGQLGTGVYSSSVPMAVDTSGVLARKRVVAIAAGYNHSLALTSEGRVYAWGFNDGRLGNNSTTDSMVPVAVDSSGVLAGKVVVAIAAAEYHSLALTADGLVVAWGSNSYGYLGDTTTTAKLVPVAVDTSGVLAGKAVKSIAAGWEHSLVVTTDGLACGWGRNWQGAVGDGSSTNRLAPVAVSTAGLLAGRFITTLAGGNNHSLALFPTEGGPVVTLEPNGRTLVQGSARLETVSFSAAAADVLPFTVRWQMSPTGPDGPFEDIAENPTASTGTLVVSQVTPASDGQAFRAVFTNEGGSRATRAVTLRVLVASGPVVFASAADCPFAGERVAVSGALDFRLEFAPTPGTTLTIVRNSGPGFIAGTFDNLPQGAVVPLTFNGLTHNYLVNYYGENGRSLVLQWPVTGLAAWGGNSYGQIGDNSTTTRYSPVAVNLSALAGKTVVAVACGGEHSLALTVDGRVFAWGNNASGQLGVGSATNSPVPLAVDVSGVLAGKRVVAVSAGASFSLALTESGEVFAWGANYYGQLGNNGTANSQQPVAVSAGGEMAGKAMVVIACGGNHALALAADGTLFSWGYNSQGQLGVGTSSSVPVRAPLAVKATGVLSGKTVVSVAGGGWHSLVLASDGTVCSWGYNGYGQLGIDATGNRTEPVAVTATGALSGKVVKSIAAGDMHSLALAADGKAFAWGMGSYGQLGVGYQVFGLLTPTAVSSSGSLSGKLVSSLAAGSYHSLATTTDSRAFAWGSGVDGALGYGSYNDRTAPEPVSITGILAGQNLVRLAGGNSHSLAMFGLGYAPVVTAQPEPRRVAAAAGASFSAAATGYPAATVRWQLSKTGPAGTFTNISGNASATTTTLVLTNLSTTQNGYAYRAVFTNSAGSVATTPAVLTVIPPPVITVPVQPMVPATDKNGAVVTFEVTANDVIDGLLAPICSPPSGSVFPIGTTMVNCTVTNSLGGTSHAMFPVTVQRSFAWYRDQYGLPDSDPLAALVHLGMSYLEAYAFGIDPTAPDRPHLPTAAIVSGHLEIAFVRWSGTADLNYVVELSDDLVAWRSGAEVTEYVSVEPQDAGLERVVVRDLAPVAACPRRYVRVRIGH
ncbi:MAG: hypothetical protein NTW21_08310 [Verrucomicrobia bacterium]|nr:hypothetical protein [Verrucomicrobiota bacterium]